jgi:hypothetical protein
MKKKATEVDLLNFSVSYFFTFECLVFLTTFKQLKELFIRSHELANFYIL